MRTRRRDTHADCYTPSNTAVAHTVWTEFGSGVAALGPAETSDTAEP